MCAHQLLKLKMNNRCYHCCSDFFFRNIISSYQLHNLIRADFQGVQKASNSHFKNKILRYLRSNHIIFFFLPAFFLSCSHIHPGSYRSFAVPLLKPRQSRTQTHSSVIQPMTMHTTFYFSAQNRFLPSIIKKNIVISSRWN